MFVVSALSMVILLLGLNIDGPLVQASEFREHLWLAVADMAGITVGSLLSILVFAFVIYTYERSLPPPKTIEPPTATELDQVSLLLQTHLGGEEE